MQHRSPLMDTEGDLAGSGVILRLGVRVVQRASFVSTAAW